MFSMQNGLISPVNCLLHEFSSSICKKSGVNNESLHVIILTDLDSLHLKFNVTVVKSTVKLSVSIYVINSSHVMSNQR